GHAVGKQFTAGRSRYQRRLPLPTRHKCVSPFKMSFPPETSAEARTGRVDALRQALLEWFHAAGISQRPRFLERLTWLA
ncbi:MAG: hypothetical protein AAEJ57_03440, partial [Opitutales bacterium]